MKRSSVLLVLVAVAVVLIYLVSGKTNVGNETEAPAVERAPVNTNAPQADTMEPPTGERDTMTRNRLQLNQGEQFAPGTAKVRIEIRAFSRLDDGTQILSAIARRVFGYGSATPPIGVDADLRIDVTRYLKNSEDGFDSLKKGECYTALLRHSRGPSLGGDDPKRPEWSLAGIQNDDQ